MRLMHPLLVLIANATESELAKCVEYLKIENQILRDRLPKKIETTPAERNQLLKVAKPLGAKVYQLLTIVTPRTFQRWVQASEKENKTPGPANSAEARGIHSQEIHDLVVKMRKDTNWGVGRIKGELYRLGYKSICRSTITRILRENGFGPRPQSDPDNTWATFLRRHASTLWACDFFTKPVLTLGGWIDYYVLFFIHLETRQVKILGITANPNNEWMKQQARNLCVFFADLATPAKYIVHDSDTKFTRDFRELLKSEGIHPVRVGPRSPDQNAVAERFVKTIKEECLERFLVFGEDHLWYLVDQFVAYYHTRRPHRGLDFRTPKQVETGKEADAVESLSSNELILRESLGGTLKWYERKAA